MINTPRKISVDQWDELYSQLVNAGQINPAKTKPLSWFVCNEGDLRLSKLQFDNSPQALELWNFLLTENDRLAKARQAGKKLVGTMKDLGTVPVLCYCFDEIVAFYPDGAWWIPCVMEMTDGLFAIADSLGVTEAYCPVRAMIGAFENCEHFPIPDMLISSTGAICDDFSAIAQLIENRGHKIHWWEIPHRRKPLADEEKITLPGGFVAPKSQLDFVKNEISEIQNALENLVGRKLSDQQISAGISKANQVRSTLEKLRETVYCAPACPLGSLEMLIAEMLAIHYCSDQNRTLEVLQKLLTLAQLRVEKGQSVLDENAARIFWINPVADLQAMNLLENAGGRITGCDYLFCHALDQIPHDVPPLDALAQMALADPMIGSACDRATRIITDIKKFGAEAVLISKIPGASHCATEGKIIGDMISDSLNLPVVEIEVPPVLTVVAPALETRLGALVETVLSRRI